VFDNKIWVIGGIDVNNTRVNDVWYSSDGFNWIQITANAGWSSRYDHSAVVLNNKIWIMGGNGSAGFLNDVWSSSNGINWTQATANAGWSARNRHTSVAFNNKIWLLGGYDASYKQDVWFSSNGVTWTQATATASWSTRYNHTSVVFNDKMWVLGGYDANYKRDVWYSSVISIPRLAEGWRTWFIRALDRAGNYRQSIQTYSIRVDTMPPIEFNLTAPADSFWTTGFGLTYSWQATTDAGSGLMKYQLWIDDSLNRDNISPNQTQTTGLDSLSAGVHTWQIRAIDSVGNVRISNQTRVIIIVDITPNLLQPPNLSWVIQRQPRFVWQGEPRAVAYYQLYIDNVLNQDSIIPPETSAVCLSPLTDGEHFWYVRVYDSLGNYKNSSQTWIVKVDSTPPAAFNLVSPQDSAFIAMPTPTLFWRKTSDAGIGFKKYEVWVNNVKIIDSLGQNDTTSTTAYAEGYHNWFIRAFDRFNNVRNSNQVRTMILDWNLPDTFSLASPTHYDTTDILLPRLSWHPAYDAGSGIKKYQLWINGVLHQESIPGTDSFALPAAPLTNNYNHTWYVKAFDYTNASRVSNQTWQFYTYDTIAPTIPELRAPVHNICFNETLPGFCWHQSFDLSGIDYYQIQYALDSSFSNAETIDVNDTAYQVSVRLLDTTYYWRVRAVDLGENLSDWSETWQFTIDSYAPEMPVLLQPVSNAWFTDSIIIFQWTELFLNDAINTKDKSEYISKSGSPVTYILQLDTNPDFSLPLISDTTQQTSDTFSLTENRYYWRVRAYDLAGNQGQFCAPDSFGIDYTQPEIPVLVLPDTNLLTNISVINFHWLSTSDNLSGVRFYTLEYDTTALFTSPIRIDSIIDTTYVAQALKSSIYFWRVCAQDWAGNTSDWSLIWSFRIFIQTPNTPLLVLPQDSLATNNPEISFVWQASASPAIQMYILQYSVDPLFTALESIVQSDTILILTLTDSVYYWRIKAIDSAGNQSEWSLTRSFEIDSRVPIPPALISPIHGAWLADTLIIFIWSNVTLNESPVLYIIQVDSNPGFTNPLIDTTGFICDTVILSEHAYYYWRVCAYDLAGNQGVFSNADSFGVDLIVPSVPVLVSPVDSLITNNPVITFTWYHAYDNLSGISGYTLEYASDMLFSNPVDTIVSDSWVTLTLTDSIYFWRAQAIDFAHNQSNWSQVRSFEIDSRAPAPPVLITPINGIWLQSVDVLFNWSEVSEPQTPVWYILHLDTSPSFPLPIIDTTTHTSDTMVLNQARYFWKIRAYDLLGNQGVFCAPDSFGIDYAIPSVPVLVVPANNAILTDTIISFVWLRATDNVSGIKHYQLQIADNSGFNNPFDTTLVDTFYLRHLQDSTDYYWRVKAVDRANNQSTFSDVRNFRIQTTHSIEENLIQTRPVSFSLNQNSPNPFAHFTQIRYTIPFTANVKITVYNTTGTEVITLTNGVQKQGWYSVQWDCKDYQGNICPNGIYFYRLETEQYNQTRNMLLLK
jgi:hypothetical protein